MPRFGPRSADRSEHASLLPNYSVHCKTPVIYLFLDQLRQRKKKQPSDIGSFSRLVGRKLSIFPATDWQHYLVLRRRDCGAKPEAGFVSLIVVETHLHRNADARAK